MATTTYSKTCWPGSTNGETPPLKFAWSKEKKPSRAERKERARMLTKQRELELRQLKNLKEVNQ